MNIDPDIQAMLKGCGLTRERVARATRGMHRDYSPCPVDANPGEWFYNWLRKWGGIEMASGRTLLSRHCPIKSIDDWNAENPDKPILVDTFNANGTRVNFYCTEIAEAHCG